MSDIDISNVVVTHTYMPEDDPFIEDRVATVEEKVLPPTDPARRANHDGIAGSLLAGIVRLEANTTKAGWAALTTAQKLAAVRVGLVLLAKLMRYNLGQLDTVGGDDSD